MKCTILVDNNPGQANELIAEHGLAIWVEINGLQLLIDTGASDAFAQNAAHLGIDISKVDYLILSHAHNDHCGGLEYFLSINKKARIYLSANIMDNLYYSTRRETKRDISIDHSLIKEHSNRVTFIHNDLVLNEDITIITKFSTNHPNPQANKTLLKNNISDDFNHELAIVIKSSKGSIIISPCSHNGILNTLESCSHIGCITHYIGGTHLVDDFESENELCTLASNIKNSYPSLTLISGHCTGIGAKTTFSKTLTNKFIEFYTGFSLIID